MKTMGGKNAWMCMCRQQYCGEFCVFVEVGQYSILEAFCYYRCVSLSVGVLLLLLCLCISVCYCISVYVLHIRRSRGVWGPLRQWCVYWGWWLASCWSDLWPPELQCPTLGMGTVKNNTISNTHYVVKANKNIATHICNIPFVVRQISRTGVSLISTHMSDYQRYSHTCASVRMYLDTTVLWV